MISQSLILIKRISGYYVRQSAWF